MGAKMTPLTVAIGEDGAFVSIKVGDAAKTAIHEEQVGVLDAARSRILRLFDNEPRLDTLHARPWIEELASELRAADIALSALWWTAPEAGDE